MRIGGLLKQSFVDWPGKIVAVVFSKGCNFRCGYCHNPTLVLPELLNQHEDLCCEEIFYYLEQRKGWLDGVVVSGGEPTIHKDLPDFIAQIRAFGYPVKLDTNGSNPEMLKLLLADKLIDFVAMDIKHLPDEKSYQQVTRCQVSIGNVITSIALIRNANVKCQFRTTAVPGIHASEVLQGIGDVVSPFEYKVNQYKETITIDNVLLNPFSEIPHTNCNHE